MVAVVFRDPKMPEIFVDDPAALEAARLDEMPPAEAPQPIQAFPQVSLEAWQSIARTPYAKDDPVVAGRPHPWPAVKLPKLRQELENPPSRL